MTEADPLGTAPGGEPGAVAPLAASRGRTLLRIQGLCKRFPGVVALDDVSFELGAGEIVALVGQNGSGKSTLVKVLAGIQHPDDGEIELVEAPGLGEPPTLRFIHQDLGLVPILSAVENLHLTGDRSLWQNAVPIRHRSERRRTRELIASFGVDFDVDAPIASLTAAERTIVAIARALDGWSGDNGILVLDEPTAALHGDEVGKLFAAVKAVAARGAGIIFISHRLDEVLGLADRIVVLRDGRLVVDQERGTVVHDELIEMIVGKALQRTEMKHRPRVSTEAVLKVGSLSGLTVKDVDLALKPGEIVGVSGVLGSGREHLSSLIFGALWRSTGTVQVKGVDLPAGDPDAAIVAGVGFVPADRHQLGALMEMNVRENLSLPDLGRLRGLGGHLEHRKERREADEWISTVGLQPPFRERRLNLFSGGNQQKVVIAKWLRNEPALLLLDEPTQGVDVGAKAAIYELVDKAAVAGAAVLVSSSDVEELALICDRVVVMRDGLISADLQREQLSEARLVSEGAGFAPAPQSTVNTERLEERSA